jgi:tRNA threonylcarbamoyladenosine biosynthesis protein TsaB
MRILGIETSGIGSQVALAEDGTVRGRWEELRSQRHAQELVPAIGRLLAEAQWRPSNLDLIAVSVGPGSYTGLRIGITCAKTLAYAAGIEVLGVGAPETIAENAPPDARRVDVLIDAQRGQVYVTPFRRDRAGTWRASAAGTMIVTVEQWANEVQPGTHLLGPALTRYRDRFASVCELGDEASWTPRVEVLMQLAWRDYQAGRRMNLHALRPLYLRKSAAEEKWDQRHASS